MVDSGANCVLLRRDVRGATVTGRSVKVKGAFEGAEADNARVVRCVATVSTDAGVEEFPIA